MTDTSTILAAWGRLRAAKYADAPPVGDFEATLCDMAARAEVAPVPVAWTLDVQVAK